MRRAAGLLIVAAIPAGCSDAPPTGQVLASVAGDDVTKRDLAFEAAASGLPPGPTTLAAIVDRKLLAHRAEREGLDHTPEYLAAIRRFREATLATLLVQREAAGARPDEPVVAGFVHGHPWMFAGRQSVELDGREGRRSVDTAVLPADDAKRLAAIPVGARGTVGGEEVRVAARRPIPMTADEIDAAARAALAGRSRIDTLRRLLDEEHRTTRVRYQSGFTPS